MIKIQIDVNSPKDKLKYLQKFIDISQKIGNFIYGDKDFIAIFNMLISYIPITIIKSKPAKPLTIPDTLASVIRKEEMTHKIVGMAILSIIILFSISIILYILTIILSFLFNTLEWWLAILTIFGIIIPLFLSLSYLFAKGEY